MSHIKQFNPLVYVLPLLYICFALHSINSLAQGKEPKVSKERVLKGIHFIQKHVDYDFRPFYSALVVDSKDKNASALGSILIFTKPLLAALNDQELLAVIAHEMAHREKFHLLTRAGTLVGASVVALFDWHNPKPYAERLRGFQEHFSLEQEIEADCMAYNWLLELKHKGFAADPNDLNKATNIIFGMDFTTVDPDYFWDLPPYIRYKNVERGYAPTCVQN